MIYLRELRQLVQRNLLPLWVLMSAWWTTIFWMYLTVHDDESVWKWISLGMAVMSITFAICEYIGSKRAK